MEYTNNNQNENINNEVSLRKYINILISEKKLIIYLTLISSIIGASYSLFKKPVWRGDFKMITKEKPSSKSSLLSNTNILSDPLMKIRKIEDNKTKLAILKSPSVLKPVYEFVKKNDPKNQLTYKKWINKKTNIKYETQDVLEVSYLDHDKELILSTLSKILDQFQEYSLSNRKKNLSQSINFLNSQKKVLSDKYQKSLAEFNKFTIENGLGNVDGFFAIETNNTSNFSDSSSNNPIKQNPIEFKNNIRETNKVAQRYAIQFANLESKEALYNQLSSRLKPNSETMINLSLEIETLKEALKRPNEILIKYRDLESTAKRNQSLFYGIIEDLELTKLEEVKQDIPWVVISPPTINELRESPKRMIIVINFFLIGILFSSIIAILKNNIRGSVVEKDDFERYLGIKFDGYIGEDINLNTLLIKQFKANLNEGDRMAILKLEDNDSDNSKYFLKDSKIKFLSLKKLTELENYQNIILIAYSGKIKLKTLNKINEYLKIYRKNIKGSLFKTNSDNQNIDISELSVRFKYIVEEMPSRLKNINEKVTARLKNINEKLPVRLKGINEKIIEVIKKIINNPHNWEIKK